MRKSIPLPAFGRLQERANLNGNSERCYEIVTQSSQRHVDTNEYFYNQFERLYEKTMEFVNKYFCQIDSVIVDKNSSSWCRDLTPELVSYIEMVAHADEFSGGWDRILSEPTQRLYLLVGILARILESKVFGELLFGATESQRVCLEKNEMVLFLEHEEGFKRTARRAERIKVLAGRSEFPLNCAIAADLLCKQIEILFQPLRGQLEYSRLEGAASFPSLGDQSLGLHEIVAAAVDLSVKVRLSSTIFYLNSELPGNSFSREYQENIDQPAYLASKAAVEASFKVKHKVDRQGSAPSKYGPLIKFTVWPSIRRYSPGSGKAEGTNDGFRIYEICKSRVVYYWARKHQPRRREQCLQEFIDQQRRDNMSVARNFAKVCGQNMRNVKIRALSEARSWKVLFELFIIAFALCVIITRAKCVYDIRNIIWRTGNWTLSMVAEKLVPLRS